MNSLTGLFGEHDLVLNIGSGNVAGAIVEFQKSTHPKILHTHEVSFPVREGVTADKLASLMLSSVHRMMAELHKEHKRKIRTVHVVFASPWFSSFSKNISIKKQAPVSITHAEIEKLVTDELKKASSAAAAESQILEKAVSHIRLNGYETGDPYGKTAKNLDISVYQSSVPAIVREKIESEIYSVIHPSKIIFHTLPFVALNVVVPLFSPKEDFVFIDIGAEISDVLVIKNGSVHSLISFPMGRNHLIRKAAINFDTAPELAASLTSLYGADMIESESKQKIKSLITAFGQEWGIRFEQAITASADKLEVFLPQKAFLVSDSNVSNIFSEIVGAKIANIVPLGRESLAQFVDFDKNDIPNIFTALSTIYLHSHPSTQLLFTNKV